MLKSSKSHLSNSISVKSALSNFTFFNSLLLLNLALFNLLLERSAFCILVWLNIASVKLVGKFKIQAVTT